jgi:uncharacterized protein (TIGR00156 family)
MKVYVSLFFGSLLLTATSSAQFTGPWVTGGLSTVEEARNAPVDTYVTITGNIIAHLREDYYRFRDRTGEIRVEIEGPVWRNRKIGPDTRVRLVAEVDRDAAGAIYLWVESLEMAE